MGRAELGEEKPEGVQALEINKIFAEKIFA